MATPENSPNRGDRDHNHNSPGGEENSSVPFDLPDSPGDRQRLEPEEVLINLPDVADIPGQENVTVPQMGAFADTTAASDDEEGTRIFGDEDYNDTTARTSEGGDEKGEGGNIVEGTP